MQSISMVTLAVADLARSIAFYEAWGWACSPDSDAACTYMLADNIVLGLLPRADLARAVGLPCPVAPPCPIAPPAFGLLLSVNGASPEAVDGLFERAVRAGAQIHRVPHWQDWAGHPGYSGFVTDLDGYLWEIAYASHLPLTDDGRLKPRPAS